MVSPNKSNTHRDGGDEHGASPVNVVLYLVGGAVGCGKLRYGLFGQGEMGAPATTLISALEGRASESGSGEENAAQEGHEHTNERGKEGLTKWFERGEKALCFDYHGDRPGPLHIATRCI
jgi:hypothetical protein